MNKDREYAEAYVSDAQRATENAANRLIQLAEDLKAYASSFPSTLDKDNRSTPSSWAANITSRLISGVANIDTSSIVYNAGKAEKHLALAENEKEVK